MVFGKEGLMDFVIKNGVKMPRKYSWVNVSSPAFKEALETVMDRDMLVAAITGPGGSGKSILYKIAYEMDPERTICAASTGIAAFNLAVDGVPAVTLHSAIHMRPMPWQDPDKPNMQAISRLMKAKTLLVDEVSMLSSNTIDFLMKQVDEVNRMRIRRGDPLRVIFFGDVMQLPPVVKTDEDEKVAELWQERYGDNVFFFNSPNYQRHFRKTIELYDVYRQENEDFRTMLNSIRMGKVSQRMLDELNSRIVPEGVFMERMAGKGAMYLAGTNKRVNELNEAYEAGFAARKVDHVTHEAYFSGDVSPADFPTVPTEVSLFLGEQVMCIANDDSEDKRYQNGTIGTIVDFHRDLPVIRTADGRVFSVHRQTFSRYRLVEDKDSGRLRSETAGEMEMIACKPAYAVTFHKAQGLTLDAAYLDFSGWMAPGSVYLGLSRLRSLDGLGMRKALSSKSIRTNPEALTFFREDRDSIPGEFF